MFDPAISGCLQRVKIKIGTGLTCEGGCEAVVDYYTRQQKSWLEKRFRSHDRNGVYLAHQPIYGFRSSPSEPGHTARYIITYRILQTLCRLSFDSLLDAGGGEGYKAHLIRKFWGTNTVVSDLSEEACRRTRGIYDLPAVTADLHELPFADRAFDVVICSESLEHVTDFKRAVDELLRISRQALIITVPHEAPIRDQAAEHHAHINAFDRSTLAYLEDRGLRVFTWRILSPLLTIPGSLADATPRPHNPNWRHSKILTEFYNRLVPMACRVFGSSTAAIIVRLDSFCSRILPFHNGILYLALKEPCLGKKLPRNPVSPEAMMAATVPLLRIVPSESDR
jgi:ubiquinone/menaquinone biosynthesis C-methylase UbiE